MIIRWLLRLRWRHLSAAPLVSNAIELNGAAGSFVQLNGATGTLELNA